MAGWQVLAAVALAAVVVAVLSGVGIETGGVEITGDPAVAVTEPPTR
ncbi:hypothetical protein [Saccharopolyspora cebuensis]|uniref:Uncharacterized protein n=1 Tax=Saccharopolyspora cebuensis TaxID=418759 RepID=A0ABV4CJ11_9PSEU